MVTMYRVSEHRRLLRGLLRCPASGHDGPRMVLSAIQGNFYARQFLALTPYTRQFLALTPQFSHVDPIPLEIIYAVQPCALKDHESNLSPSLKSARKKLSTSRGTCSAHKSKVLFTCQHRSRLVFHGERTIPAATIIGPSPRSQGEPTWTGAACAQHAKDTQRVQCGSTPMPRPALSHAHVTTKKMQTNPTSEGVYHNDRTAASCAVVPSAHAARSFNESGQHTQPITSTNHPGYHRAHACTSAANQHGCGGRTRP